MRRVRPRRPTSWELLAVVVVALALMSLALFATERPTRGDSPDRPVADALEADLTVAESGAEVRAVFRDKAVVLVEAGVLVEVSLSADGRVLARFAAEPPDGFTAADRLERTVTGEAGTFQLVVVGARPDDVVALRRRDDVVQGLLAAMTVALAGALWVSRRRHAEDRRIALVDPLTGVGNRRQLDRLAVRLLREPADGRRHGLLLVDLDGFKQINDRHGHEHGDLVLRRLAEALQETVRPHDHVARLGGDEFAVLLEDLPEGAAASEVMRNVLTRLRESLPDVGISGGAAVWPDEGCDLAALSRVADRRMYKDKERRRAIDLRDPIQRVGAAAGRGSRRVAAD